MLLWRSSLNFFSAADLRPTARTILGHDIAIDTQVGLRPEHLTVADSDNAVVEGTLELVENLGEYALVHLLTKSNVEFIAKTERPPEVTKGSQIAFSIKPELAHFFNAESGQRLT